MTDAKGNGGGGKDGKSGTGGMSAPKNAPPSAGIAPPNAGIGPPNADTAPRSAGTAPPNAGTAPPNAGTAPMSAGTAPMSAGTAPMSAANAPPSAGTAPPSAGTAPPNAGTAPRSAANAPVSAATDAADENKLIAERRAKLAQLREAAKQSSTPVFPNDFRRNALAAQLLDAFGEREAEWLDANPTHVSVGGRMLFKRVMGKASFVKIADRTGQIQLFLQHDALGAATTPSRAGTSATSSARPVSCSAPKPTSCRFAPTACACW